MQRVVGTFRARLSVAMLAGVAFAIVNLAVGPKAAVASPLTPIAQASGSCPTTDANGDTDDQPSYTYPSLASPVPYPIEELTTQGSGGFWNDSGAFGPDDVSWVDDRPLAAGETPGGNLSCDQSLSYTAQLFEAPTTPAAFSGATSAGDSSTLEFLAPGTADYDAVVSVQSGAVQLEGLGNPVASRATIPLGQLSPGANTIDVEAEDGPQAAWTVTIQAIPGVLTGPSFGVSAAQPGSDLPLSYSITADGSVTAEILNNSGAVLRTFATALPVSAGSHTLTWDGYDANGNPPSNGTYTARLTYTDDAGNVVTQSAAIYISTAPPLVTELSPSSLRSFSAFVFAIADPAGVTSASVLLQNKRVGTVHEDGTFTIGPRYAWAPGVRYRISINATDQIGNQGVSNISFVGSPVSVGQFDRFAIVQEQKLVVAYMTQTPDRVCFAGGSTSLSAARADAALIAGRIRGGRSGRRNAAVGPAIRRSEGWLGCR